MQKITPFLWFNANAEEAMNFYVSVFKNSKIININRMPADSPDKPGAVMSVTFELEGQTFMGLNGGPQFTFSEAVSLFVACASQTEVDQLWNALIADGGQPSQCGWLKDKFGLSWQIIPKQLGEALANSDPKKAGAAMQAMLGMTKIDIETLEEAQKAA